MSLTEAQIAVLWELGSFLNTSRRGSRHPQSQKSQLLVLTATCYLAQPVVLPSNSPGLFVKFRREVERTKTKAKELLQVTTS